MLWPVSCRPLRPQPMLKQLAQYKQWLRVMMFYTPRKILSRQLALGWWRKHAACQGKITDSSNIEWLWKNHFYITEVMFYTAFKILLSRPVLRFSRKPEWLEKNGDTMKIEKTLVNFLLNDFFPNLKIGLIKVYSRKSVFGCWRKPECLEKMLQWK